MLHGGEVLPTVVLETNFGDIPMEMLENNAPGTVDNFLTYVEDNDFINSIFHRRPSPLFVLQGGGFRASSAQLCDAATCAPADVNPANFDAVPTDPPIVNEFDVSNTRGTVAMAKTQVSPDTATSQFFVSLVDNSFLDSQNGGFTVFARVKDMTAVDEIAALDTINLSSLFSGSPLSAIVSAPVNGNQIVRVERISGDAVIHGTVFLDINGNSLRGPGEGGISDRIVYLDANNDGMRDSREVIATTDRDGNFHFRVAPGEQTIRLETSDSFDLTMTGDRFDVALDLGRSSKNRDFGLRYNGSSWTNPLNETDVNAINGINATDVLLIINELVLRNVSNPTDGRLPSENTNPNDPTFYDVDSNGFVAPRDAIIVINELSTASQLNAPSGANESAFETTDLPTQDRSLVGDEWVGPQWADSLGQGERVVEFASPVAFSTTTLSDAIASGEDAKQRAADQVFEHWLCVL